MGDQKQLTKIRNAKSDDCPEIRRLIQELADYEKMSDGPKIGAESLKNDGFGPQSFFQCLVAECQSNPDQLIGYCLYFFTYSVQSGREVYMEDLYVTPNNRGQGLGKGMWQTLVKDALSKGCVQCNFSVLNWNKPSIEFYNQQGAFDVTTPENRLQFRFLRPAIEAFSPPALDAKFSIRIAQPQDCGSIHALIRQRCQPMGSALGLKAFQLDGFETGSPFYQCLVVEHVEAPKTVVGYCLYYFTFSTWEARSVEMADIFVSAPFRGNALGKAMIGELFQVAVRNNCQRCNLEVLKSNRSSMDFLLRIGAMNLTEAEGWLLFKMNKSAMKKFCGGN